MFLNYEGNGSWLKKLQSSFADFVMKFVQSLRNCLIEVKFVSAYLYNLLLQFGFYLESRCMYDTYFE